MPVTGANGSSLALLTKCNWSQRSNPGILVFSHKLQLLHMNQRALDLTGQAKNGPGTMILSRAVTEFRTHIQALLGRFKEAHATEFFDVKRVVVESGQTISLRGIGVPDRNSGNRPRIVMVLEDISQPDASTAPEAIIQESSDHTKGRTSRKEG